MENLQGEAWVFVALGLAMAGIAVVGRDLLSRGAIALTWLAAAGSWVAGVVLLRVSGAL